MIFRGTDGLTGEMTFFSDCILSSLARILSKVKHAILENSSSMLKLSAARLSVFSKTLVGVFVEYRKNQIRVRLEWNLGWGVLD